MLTRIVVPGLECVIWSRIEMKGKDMLDVSTSSQELMQKNIAMIMAHAVKPLIMTVIMSARGIVIAACSTSSAVWSIDQIVCRRDGLVEEYLPMWTAASMPIDGQ